MCRICGQRSTFVISTGAVADVAAAAADDDDDDGDGYPYLISSFHC